MGFCFGLDEGWSVDLCEGFCDEAVGGSFLGIGLSSVSSSEDEESISEISDSVSWAASIWVVRRVLAWWSSSVSCEVSINSS